MAPQGIDVVRVQGAQDVLSNFYIPGDKQIAFQKFLFKSVEHAYQFAKAYHYGEFCLAHEIRGSRNAHIAKNLGQRVKGKGTWEFVKVEVMRSLLQIKFDTIPDFQHALLNTRGKLITHPVRDSFWGKWQNKGRDKFSELLMELRDNPLKKQGMCLI